MKLVNNNNLCFVNSVVQQLYNIPTLRHFFTQKEYIQAGEERTSKKICNEISQLFCTPETEVTSAAELRRLVGIASESHYLYSGIQQDMVDFLTKLLAEVLKEISSENWEAKVVLKEFEGLERTCRKFVETIDGKCNSCLMLPSVDEQPFNILHIDVPDTQMVINLSSLLENQQHNDIVKIRCGNCCEHIAGCPQTGKCIPRKSTSQKDIVKAPDILVVQLSRFSSATGGKIKTKVWPDDILKLETGESYRLNSISHHLGETPKSGHYVSSVKRGDNWFRCNDTKIVQITENNAKSNDCHTFVYLKLFEETTPFIPSNEWQNIKGRRVPGGLHYSFGTRNYAKLLNDQCPEESLSNAQNREYLDTAMFLEENEDSIEGAEKSLENRIKQENNQYSSSILDPLLSKTGKKYGKKTDSVENVESPGAAQKRDISSEDNIKKESQQFSYYVQDLLHSTNKETNTENNVTQKEVDKQNLKLEKNETLYKNLCQKNETKYEKGKRYFSVMTDLERKEHIKKLYKEKKKQRNFNSTLKMSIKERNIRSDNDYVQHVQVNVIQSKKTAEERITLNKFRLTTRKEKKNNLWKEDLPETPSNDILYNNMFKVLTNEPTFPDFDGPLEDEKSQPIPRQNSVKMKKKRKQLSKNENNNCQKEPQHDSSSQMHWYSQFKKCFYCFKTHTPVETKKFCNWAEQRKRIRNANNINHDELNNCEKKLSKNNHKLLQKRIKELQEEENKQNIVSRKTNKREHRKKEKKRKNNSTRSISKSTYLLTLMILLMFYIMPSYQYSGTDILSNLKLEDYLLIITVLILLFSFILLICYFIIELCCTLKSKTTDIEMSRKYYEKIPTEDKLNTELTENVNYSLTNEIEILEEKCPEFDYFDPELIDPSFVQISSCSHFKMLMRFDDSENLEEAIVVNKCIGKAYQIKNEEIEDQVSKIEECHCNPGEKIVGQGKKNKGDDQVQIKKFIGMKNIEDKHCSIISILISLFNNQEFKLAMEEFYVNENSMLCKVGSCQFCLIVNLYIRYANSKRTILPEEILGLTASREADNTSIDVIYKMLVGSLQNDANNLHPELKLIKSFAELNMNVSVHEKCGEKPDISRHLIYRYTDNHNLADWQTDCKCDDIAEVCYSWLDRERANKLVICEKQAIDVPLIRNIEIDNVRLILTSAIVKEENHFKCIIPDNFTVLKIK